MVARNVRVATPAPSRPAMSGRTRSASAVSGESISLVTAITRPPTRNRRAASTVSRVRPDAEIATKTRSSAGGVGAEVDASSAHAGMPARGGLGGRRHRRIPRAAQAAEHETAWSIADRCQWSVVRRVGVEQRRERRWARRRCPHGACATRSSVTPRLDRGTGRASPRSARTAAPAGMSRRRRTRRAPCRPRRRAAGHDVGPRAVPAGPPGTPRGTARAPARSGVQVEADVLQPPAVGGFRASTMRLTWSSERSIEATSRSAGRCALRASTGLSGSPSKSTMRNPSGAINTWPRW